MPGIWFSDKTPRLIKLRSAVMLVGKEPTKTKTIKSMWTMFLDKGGEDQITGLPEWLENARNFVMKNGETIAASQVVREVNIIFTDSAHLFKKTPTEAPKSQIDHFSVKRMGSADEPDTVVTFETRTPFSTDLWNFLGQQGGEEFEAEYELSSVDEQPALGGLTLVGDEPVVVNPDEHEGDASEGEEDYETARADACKAEHDAEFGAAKEKKAKTLKPPTARQVADATKALSIM